MEILEMMKDYEVPNPDKFLEERVQLFKERLQVIIAHNKNPSKKFAMAINKLAFYTEEELSKYLNPMAPQDCSATAAWTMMNNKKVNIDKSKLPNAIDWRK